jgi:poly(3-hydroxybutyrate) depolymerase
MKLRFQVPFAIALASLIFSVSNIAQAQAPADGKSGAKGGGAARLTQSPDPRAQNRTYHFEDTNEDLPYCLVVSSKVSKDKKAPLIVSLHGLGIGPGFMCRGKAVDLAEEGGYILVAPMGYNTGGWYGSPVINGGPGRGKGKGGDGAVSNPPNLAELSEKDVVNVLAIVRKEFNVDDKRTYLMGHSMGGAGALFLGSKLASEWAAIAAMAPAAFRLAPNATAILTPLKEKSVPVLIAQGDADTLVPPAGSRQWAETMKEMKMEYQYKEVPGADHGSVIEASIPDIFAFFAAHVKN